MQSTDFTTRRIMVNVRTQLATSPAATERQAPAWSLVVASNNEHVLRHTLLASPGIDSRCQVIVERDSPSAGRAYNRGLDKAKADIVVFAHQDVFLPDDWFPRLGQSIRQIESSGEGWGVLGVFGATAQKPPVLHGFCYSTGLQRILGAPFSYPVATRTLDELVLVVRRSSGLRFDGQLPGFHLYGTDMCLQAEAVGLKNYIIPAFCIHNSKGIVRIPAEFWKAYFHLRKKWFKVLPVTTCCTKITRMAWPVVRRIGAEWRALLRPQQVGERSEQVASLYQELLLTHPGIRQSPVFNPRRVKIGLIGATLETPNLGVSVLATGAVGCVQSAFPESDVFFLDYAREGTVRMVATGKGTVQVPLVNMRFSKKVWLSNNLSTLLLAAVVLRVLPFGGLRKWMMQKNSCLREICSADLFGAVAGGDSFSDLYGCGRFLYVALPQVLVLLLGKRLVLLPQTYGPFQRRWTRFVAAWIVSHAERAWCRDQRSLAELKGSGPHHEEADFCYDMGFGIDSIAPECLAVDGIYPVGSKRPHLVGMNISGLLFRNGYSGKNEFKMLTNYVQLVHAIIELLLASPETTLILVPHVYGAGEDSESDATACEQVFAELRSRYPGRIGVLRGEYGPNEIRFVIGLCEFFVGSRMHACIAAVSQCIPAVSIAYSDKFRGVMREAGVDSLVADARTCPLEDTLAVVQHGFERRAELAKELEARMPAIRATVSNLLRGIPAFV